MHSSKVENSLPKPHIRCQPRVLNFLALKEKKSQVNRKESLVALWSSLKLIENCMYISYNQTHKEKAVIGRFCTQPTELAE